MPAHFVSYLQKYRVQLLLTKSTAEFLLLVSVSLYGLRQTSKWPPWAVCAPYWSTFNTAGGVIILKCKWNQCHFFAESSLNNFSFHVSKIHMCVCVCVCVCVYIYIYIIFFILSSVNRYLDCFHILAILNNAAMNIWAY